MSGPLLAVRCPLLKARDAYRRAVPEFERDGIRLHYEVAGVGVPVVMLHGFTSRGSSWKRHGWVDALLASGLGVVLPDARSHGRSSKLYESAGCATEVLAADVLGLLDHLGIGSAHLLEFSMGGAVAIEIALSNPSRVRSLVVGGVGDAAMNDLHDAAEIAAIAEAFADPAAEVDLDSQAHRLRANARCAGNNLAALLPFLQGGGWPGGLRTVGQLTMPALVIVAETDEYMANVDVLLSELEPTEVLRLPGKSHHHVMPDDNVKQRVVAFFRAVPT